MIDSLADLAAFCVKRQLSQNDPLFVSQFMLLPATLRAQVNEMPEKRECLVCPKYHLAKQCSRAYVKDVLYSESPDYFNIRLPLQVGTVLYFYVRCQIEEQLHQIHISLKPLPGFDERRIYLSQSSGSRFIEVGFGAACMASYLNT
jgi:hypothetical protein